MMWKARRNRSVTCFGVVINTFRLKAVFRRSVFLAERAVDVWERMRRGLVLTPSLTGKACIMAYMKTCNWFLLDPCSQTSDIVK